MSDTVKPVEETSPPPAAEPVSPAPLLPLTPTTESTEQPPAQEPEQKETTGVVAAPASETPAETAEAAKEQHPTEQLSEDQQKEQNEQKEESTEQTPKEEQEQEAAKDAPATLEGRLGHKGPGFTKQFRFSKRHFWLGDEPVDHKNLLGYLQNEKHHTAHHNTAWASQTGHGLLFYAKRAEDKIAPHGVINLSDVSDVVKDGYNELVLKAAGHKHTLQADDAKQRDTWHDVLQQKIAEAKAKKEEIVNSEGYKTTLEKLRKHIPISNSSATSPAPKKEEKPAEEQPSEPAALSSEAAVAPATTEKPAEPVPEAPAEKKESEKPAEAPKASAKDMKARSQSRGRKRMSMFGSLLGKKGDESPAPTAEEKGKMPEASGLAANTVPTEELTEEGAKDVNKETAAEQAAQDKPEEVAVAESSKAHETPSETPAAADASEEAPKETTKPEEQAVAAEQPKTEEKPAEAQAAVPTLAPTSAAPVSPAPLSPREEKKSKRSSFFGIFNHKDKSSEKPKQGAEKKPEESHNVVSSTAPQLDTPVAPEPIAAEDVTKTSTQGNAPATAAPAEGEMVTEAGKEKQESGGIKGTAENIAENAREKTNETVAHSAEKAEKAADRITAKAENTQRAPLASPNRGVFSKFLKKDKGGDKAEEKKKQQEKAEKTEAPAAATAEAAPVNEEAKAEATEPAAAAAAPAETPAAVEEPTTPATETPAGAAKPVEAAPVASPAAPSKEVKEKRRTSLFTMNKKKENPTSESEASEGEGKKILGLFRRNTKAKKDKKDAAAPAAADKGKEAEQRPDAVIEENEPTEVVQPTGTGEVTEVPGTNVAVEGKPVEQKEDGSAPTKEEAEKKWEDATSAAQRAKDAVEDAAIIKGEAIKDAIKGNKEEKNEEKEAAEAVEKNN
ncbi:hypothetical protein KEM55_002277 [Ascosphaera atra]|nr:hypothetical protein KEM55_002277 [Ascosphaera atra]